MYKKKILFIEDEPEMMMVLKIRLEASGFAVISAMDGEEGLRKACLDKPDLILLDLILPKMDGYEVCRRLKKDLNTKDIPVIIITASGEEDIEKKCVAYNADDFIKKPYDSEELLVKIKALLKE